MVCLISTLILAGCGSHVVANAPSAIPIPTVNSNSSPAASAAGGEQDTVLGPGGMTLPQEIGAVMMVGFKGPLTPGVLDDWRRHQFGGLIVVPINQNAPDAAAIRQLIQSVRGVMLHPLMAASNQEGGAAQSEQAAMSRGLKALGFDINVVPVADAQDVMAAIAGIHAAGMYAAATHFPGHGTANDFISYRAAIAAHVEFVMIGHLSVPSIDGSAPASMSATVLRVLRSDLGYPGVIISDDLQTAALSPLYPPPLAAVRFLNNGGDMVIVSHDIAVADATYEAIHAAVLNGSYPRAQLDASVQKLLSLGLRYMP
jgi:beta-glucosidase-like glycosyl hydrolase